MKLRVLVDNNTLNDQYYLGEPAVCYYIEDETLVEDANIIYTVIKFSKGRKKYNYEELYLGPILISKNDLLFQKKNDKEIKTIEMILSRIEKGHLLYKLKLKRNLKILKKRSI